MLNVTVKRIFLQAIKQEMETCEGDFKSAVENYQELSNTSKYMFYIQDRLVDEKCDSLRKKWDTLTNGIPERVESLKEELSDWRSFHEKLDAFIAWVEEMEGFTKIEKPRDETEAMQQLKGLEVSTVPCEQSCYDELQKSAFLFNVTESNPSKVRNTVNQNKHNDNK